MKIKGKSLEKHPYMDPHVFFRIILFRITVCECVCAYMCVSSYYIRHILSTFKSMFGKSTYCSLTCNV